MHLRPYNSNLKILQCEDCYTVAKEAEDHTLFLMAPSPQTEEEKAAESTWISPPPLPPRVFDLHEKHRRRVYASPQAQEETSSTFVPPPNIRPLPYQQEPVKSTAEVH